jgi:hypothetical protein
MYSSQPSQQPQYHTQSNTFPCQLEISNNWAVSMLFVELKTATNNKGLYNVQYLQQGKIKFELPKHNVQTVKDMDIPKIIAISNQDTLNSKMTTWQTNATEKKDLVMSNVSSVAEIFLRITRAVRSTMSYKRSRTHLSIWNNTLLPHKSIPIHSTRSNICSNNQTNFLRSQKYTARANLNQPHRQTSDIQDLIRWKSFLSKWKQC